MSERAPGICARLISQRLVPREELPELEMDQALRDEVSQRLREVGLVLLERPSIPYLGVAIAGEYRDAINLSDLGITSRTLSLLLYAWLQLVAPYLYGGKELPDSYTETTIAEEALLQDLPGHWTKTGLGQETGKLKRLHFLDKVRGESAWHAGSMLWLAIEHDQLIQFLRRHKGLPKAIERYMQVEKMGEAEG